MAVLTALRLVTVYVFLAKPGSLIELVIKVLIAVGLLLGGFVHLVIAVSMII